MKTHIISLVLAITYCATFSQNLTGAQLLEKAIAYHDPNNLWSTFNGKLLVTMETPNSPKRDSEIVINLPNKYFYVKAVRDTISTEYTLDKGNCSIKFNNNSDFDEETAKTHRLSCERANMYKNYYTYLYGLPMKLKDKGTIVHDNVEQKTFKGKEYLVLKATYEGSVGNDIWYFYFNPKTFAMEIYQFFRKDENGKQNNDSGEYILLTEEENVGGIKMPKNRAWYYNSDDKYLGTDILKAK